VLMRPDVSCASDTAVIRHDPSLTREGGCHMVLHKDRVETANPGRIKGIPIWRCQMPLNLTTLTLVASPVTLEEGLNILERDEYRCQYCGLDGMASFENALAMSVDFVIPRARKGKKDPRNLVACCRSCNMIKGRRVYRSFDEAKAYVLARREELCEAWETRKATPTKPAKAQKPAQPEASRAASASVVGNAPLSIRKG
jgi:hypothetical protein